MQIMLMFLGMHVNGFSGLQGIFGGNRAMVFMIIIIQSQQSTAVLIVTPHALIISKCHAFHSTI